MNFRLQFPIPALEPPISYGDKLLLMGSCFAEEMGGLLDQHKFDVLLNPHGILYNPASLVNALNGYLSGKVYEQSDLFFHEGLWHSWDHHGRFSDPDAGRCLDSINRSATLASRRLSEADWLVLTFGSAFVYSLKEDHQIVANCHKLPAYRFEKKMLRPDEVVSTLDNFMHRLFLQNHRVKILFTISPVRYAKDGVTENQLSKAVLLLAVHQLVRKFDRLYYFPAYELVIDDLRDYRFFKEDLVHPNDMAVQYVWEKFTAACLSPESHTLLQAVSEILKAAGHRQIHGQTEAYKRFAEKYQTKIRQLKRKYPFLNFEREEKIFSSAME